MRVLYSALARAGAARSEAGEGRRCEPSRVPDATCPDRKELPQYVARRPRASARTGRLRFPRAFDHVRARLGHGSVDAYLRDVSDRPDHDRRVPRAPRPEGPHRQPRRAHAHEARLRRRGLHPQARRTGLRRRSALAASRSRLGRDRQDREAPPPRHAGHLRRPVLDVLPRGARGLRLRRLRHARRLDRGADPPAARGGQGRRRPERGARTSPGRTPPAA